MVRAVRHDNFSRQGPAISVLVNSSMKSPKSLKHYSNASFEILIGVLTIAPVIILIAFYQQLSSQIPVFLNWRGEVEVWAAKNPGSVFRVPAMAADLQLICLLMKYGAVKSWRQVDEGIAGYQGQVTRSTTRLWDWLRCFVAFKMAAASLEPLFISVDSLRFLLTPAWILTWTAAIVSIVAAGHFGYRLRQLKRERGSPVVTRERDESRDHLIGGLIYFNREDPALFVETYLLNFGNKWVYVLIGSLVAYPLLVFLPG
jgi:uncharacterized membrane protein